jgi:hypothetical protein
MWILCSEGMLAAFQGDTDRALEYISKIERMSVRGTTAVNPIALVYYALNDMDKFFKCMDLSLENHTLPGTMLRFSPMLAKAREDPRYQELLKKEDWSSEKTKVAV